MEQLAPQYDEAQMQKLLDAYRIAKKAFPDMEKEELLNLLDICQQNDGLYVLPKSSTLIGMFRYFPYGKVGDRNMIDVVADCEFDALKKLDLKIGPVVHGVGFASSENGYRIARSVICNINAQAFSWHRIKNGERYFCLRKNVRYKADV